MEAHLEFEESIRDLLGPCSEVLLDLEGRQISPDWLDVPEKVVLALLRHGVVPGEDRHLLFRVPNPFIEQDEEKVSKILASVARANVLFHLACEQVGHRAEAERDPRADDPAGELDRRDRGRGEDRLALPARPPPASSRRPASSGTSSSAAASPRRGAPRCSTASLRVRLVPLCENVGRARAAARPARGLLPRARARQGRRGPADARHLPHLLRPRRRPRCACSWRCPTPPSRAARSRPTPRSRWRSPGARRPSAGSPPTPRASGSRRPSVTYLIGAGRAGFRGGFDPAHPGVLRQFARADGVTVQGIRADSPEGTERLAAAFRAEVAARAKEPALDAAAVRRRVAVEAARGGRARAHRDAAAHRAAPRAVREPRAADARAHPRDRLRQLRPLDPDVPGGVGRRAGAARQPRPARRLARGRHAAAGDRLQPRLHDARPAGRDERPRRRSTGARRCCSTATRPATARSSRASCPSSSRSRPPSSSGRSSRRPPPAAASAPRRRCGSTPGPREELVAPTCLFAMEYLRYLAEDSESWDETKEHESQTTREEELVRETSSIAFAAAVRRAAGRPLARAADPRRRRGRRAPAARPRADARGEARVRGPAHRGLAARARRLARPRAAPRVVAPARAVEGRARARRDPAARSPSRSCAAASGRERAPPSPAQDGGRAPP